RNNDRSAEQRADEDPKHQCDDIGRIADYNSVADLSGNSGDDVLGPRQSQDVAALDHRTRRDGNILTAAHNAAEENAAQRKIRLRYFAERFARDRFTRDEDVTGEPISLSLRKR